MNLREECKRYIADAGADGAYDAMWRRLNDDTTYYRSLADEMVSKAIRGEIKALLDAERSATFYAKRAAVSRPSSVTVLVEAERRRVADLIICGKRIGDCTRDDLLAFAVDRRGKAATMLANATYFERLAEGMSETDTVENRYDDGTLDAILAETGEGLV